MHHVTPPSSYSSHAKMKLFSLSHLSHTSSLASRDDTYICQACNKHRRSYRVVRRPLLK